MQLVAMGDPHAMVSHPLTGVKAHVMLAPMGARNAGILSPEAVRSYRAQSYRLAAVRSKDQAITFVQQRGFVFFWPIEGVELPSLWTAVAGDRPVPSQHDDPGHVTWGWKDSLLGKKRWYYAKVLRRRATLISMETAPYFYALTENYGAPEEDYLIQYEAGGMTAEAKSIYEALLKEGALDTIALRRATRLSSRDSSYRFERGLTELQADFKILPVGVAEAGAWRYAFRYDIVPRHLPELPEAARLIGERQARAQLLSLYFRSVAAAPIAQPAKLFQWKRTELQRTVQELTDRGELLGGLELQGQPGEWIARTELVG